MTVYLEYLKLFPVYFLLFIRSWVITLNIKTITLSLSLSLSLLADRTGLGERVNITWQTIKSFRLARLWTRYYWCKQTLTTNRSQCRVHQKEQNPPPRCWVGGCNACSPSQAPLSSTMLHYNWFSNCYLCGWLKYLSIKTFSTDDDIKFSMNLSYPALFVWYLLMCQAL